MLSSFGRQGRGWLLSSLFWSQGSECCLYYFWQLETWIFSFFIIIGVRDMGVIVIVLWVREGSVGLHCFESHERGCCRTMSSSARNSFHSYLFVLITYTPTGDIVIHLFTLYTG